jgi:hypothetical protein
VTFAGLASADNRVAEPNLIYPLSNGTEPEILIRQMSAMGHSRTFRGGGGMSAKGPIVDINEPITALNPPRPPGGSRRRLRYEQMYSDCVAYRPCNTGYGSQFEHVLPGSRYSYPQMLYQG